VVEVEVVVGTTELLLTADEEAAADEAETEAMIEVTEPAGAKMEETEEATGATTLTA